MDNNLLSSIINEIFKNIEIHHVLEYNDGNSHMVMIKLNLKRD